MLGDVEVEKTPSVMSEDDDDEQDSEARGRYGEEVDRHHLGEVVRKECTPGLGRRRLPPPWNVLRDRGLGDLQTELEQFPVDPGRSPQWVGGRHAADEVSDLAGDNGPW